MKYYIAQSQLTIPFALPPSESRGPCIQYIGALQRRHGVAVEIGELEGQPHNQHHDDTVGKYPCVATEKHNTIIRYVRACVILLPTKDTTIAMFETSILYKSSRKIDN
jgi:hypothetical protein